MTKKKKTDLVKSKKTGRLVPVAEEIPLGQGSASQIGIDPSYTTLSALLGAWQDGTLTTPDSITAGTPNQNEPTATPDDMASHATVAEANFPDAATWITNTLESGLGYGPDDVDVNAENARTAILNATRSKAEINFRRAVGDLTAASIYGASRGTVAKYVALLKQLGSEIEEGIVAGEHEYVQALIAEAQVKANIVTGKLPSRASIITSDIDADMKGRISNSEHEQEKLRVNATMGTQVSIANADNAAKIRVSYNNFLASVYGTEVNENRGLASILAAAVSQMGKPGISWVYI